MIRRALWIAGAPFRAILVAGIRLYRMTLSGWLSGQCRFYPSCSHYAEDAIRRRGAVRGSVLAGWRILRCNPFGEGGIDPVPGPLVGSSYDDLIHSVVSREAQA